MNEIATSPPVAPSAADPAESMPDHGWGKAFASFAEKDGAIVLHPSCIEIRLRVPINVANEPCDTVYVFEPTTAQIERAAGGRKSEIQVGKATALACLSTAIDERKPIQEIDYDDIRARDFARIQAVVAGFLDESQLTGET